MLKLQIRELTENGWETRKLLLSEKQEQDQENS